MEQYLKDIIASYPTKPYPKEYWEAKEAEFTKLMEADDLYKR